MKTEHSFSVGFARVDITPEESVPLAGYGNTLQRLSQGVLDPLYATCIAITDNGSTLLLCTVDLINTMDFYCAPARDAISEKYGIPREAVVFSAIHTHSAPDLSQKEYPPIIRYKDQLVKKLTDMAGAALTDRKPAVMLGGRTYNEGMNFVRHYILEDGSYAGDNFGDFDAASIRDHVSEADRQIQLVKFCREGGKDILMVNWQAHPTKASTRVTEHGWSNRPYLSADFVGACRDYVEEKTGLHFAYFQGACGNINSRSRIAAEDATDDHVLYGQQLGDCILAGLDSLQPLQAGATAAKDAVVTSPINHSDNHLLPYTDEIVKLWRETNDPKLCTAKARPYGIHSAYHAMFIQRKAAMSGTLQFTLGAGCAGDLGFVFLPYEVFDTNGMYIKENSPFAMTFILECANGMNNYIPSARGFEHGCYESDNCNFQPGTGEKAADTALEILNELHQGR